MGTFTNITLGADPEVFMYSGENPVSAYGVIPGTKKEPYAVNHGAVQVDGMALEFNINPVATEEDFVLSVFDVLESLKSMVPTFSVKAEPVAHFGLDYIREQPYEATRLGCDPDFNAWSGRRNPTPDPRQPFRTAAGHVHIGWTEGEKSKEHKLLAFKLVKQLDFFLGIPSLLFDDNTERRKLYGKAGCCRVKSYGVEYRVLSNAWLKSEALTSWVFRAAKSAIDAFEKGNILEEKYGNIEDILNNSDVLKAKSIIAEEGLEVPDDL